jgi:hypothetical protein
LAVRGCLAEDSQAKKAANDENVVTDKIAAN